VITPTSIMHTLVLIVGLQYLYMACACVVGGLLWGVDH